MGHSCTASSGRRAIAQKLDPQGQGSLPARIPGLITSTLKKMPMDATRHLHIPCVRLEAPCKRRERRDAGWPHSHGDGDNSEYLLP